MEQLASGFVAACSANNLTKKTRLDFKCQDVSLELYRKPRSMTTHLWDTNQDTGHAESRDTHEADQEQSLSARLKECNSADSNPPLLVLVVGHLSHCANVAVAFHFSRGGQYLLLALVFFFKR